MRLATLLWTLGLSLAPLLGQAVPAAAQSAPAPAPDPAVIRQQIHTEAYSRCMSDPHMGAAGADQQENCSCAADTALSLLSDEAKQAIADGSITTFKGALLKGDETFRDLALIKSCPKLVSYLHQQFCSKDASNPHCQMLEKAQQEAQ